MTAILGEDVVDVLGVERVQVLDQRVCSRHVQLQEASEELNDSLAHLEVELVETEDHLFEIRAGREPLDEAAQLFLRETVGGGGYRGKRVLEVRVGLPQDGLSTLEVFVDLLGSGGQILARGVGGVE